MDLQGEKRKIGNFVTRSGRDSPQRDLVLAEPPRTKPRRKPRLNSRLSRLNCVRMLQKFHKVALQTVVARQASRRTVFTASSKSQIDEIKVCILYPLALSDIQRETGLSHPDPASDSPSTALVAHHSPYLLTTYSRPPLVFVRGEGSYLWDLENRSLPPPSLIQEIYRFHRRYSRRIPRLRRPCPRKPSLRTILPINPRLKSLPLSLARRARQTHHRNYKIPQPRNSIPETLYL